MYKGMWKNFMQHGEGTLYDSKGNRCYFGNWENGHKHGIGIEYDEQGKVIFEGKFN